MQGKKENVNLQCEIEKSEDDYAKKYCTRKIKNFMYTSSIFSIIYSGVAIANHDYPDIILGIGCSMGLYSIGKLIGSKKPPLKLYSHDSISTPIIIDQQLYELEQEKKCYTLSKHHD